MEVGRQIVSVRGHANSAPCAFSLLEMLAVLVVVAILATLAIVGFGHLRRSASDRDTRVALQAAMALLAEADATTRLAEFPTGAAAAPAADVGRDGSGRTAAVANQRAVMAMLLRYPGSRKALQQVHTDRLEGTDPPALLDGYGNPLLYVPPGGITGVTVNRGSAAERIVDIAAPNNRPFFASAGGDGRFDWGDDNVYSFEK